MPHLKSNIEALGLRLSTEDIAEIETAYDFQVKFPHNFYHGQNRAPGGTEDIIFMKRLGHLDYVQQPQAIQPFPGDQVENDDKLSQSLSKRSA